MSSDCLGFHYGDRADVLKKKINKKTYLNGQLSKRFAELLLTTHFKRANSINTPGNFYAEPKRGFDSAARPAILRGRITKYQTPTPASANAAPTPRTIPTTLPVSLPEGALLLPSGDGFGTRPVSGGNSTMGGNVPGG
jgi:hypothetical protein